MTSPSLLSARDLSLDTPAGRPLFRDLNLSLGRERVALVGRNGVGKSTLLDVLAGEEKPNRGQVVCHGQRLLVRQQIDAAQPRRDHAGISPGELRRWLLQRAREARPDLLLLDEPTLDLDSAGIEWLVGWLGVWTGGLVVVSHHRQLLRTFREFFIVAESGCRHFSGSFDGLLADLARESDEREATYVRNLNRLVTKEKRNAKVRRRRQRKKNLGRIHELGRCPSRAKLNENRSYAQESQGKRAVLQKARIGAMRDWAKATRRALSVKLPLELALPQLPNELGPPIAVLDGVTARVDERILFQGVTLSVRRDRVAVTGPNGSGKTTLLEILTGERLPTSGRSVNATHRLGYIAQNGSNWRSGESVVEHLFNRTDAVTPEAAASLLRAHQFPFALADRPLRSLSPGERVRAALICLCRRSPAPELLVLDEPTHHLDFVGASALESVLGAWRGGLVVVSHDEEFLRAIGVETEIRLGG